MRMGFGKAPIDLFQKCRFGMVPKRRIMAESAALSLANGNHILMAERFTVLQSLHRLSYAGWIVNHPKRIHHRIET